MDRYSKLREVFRLMNYKDADQNFTREIKLFEEILSSYEDHAFQTTSNFSLYTDKEKEGGHMEFRKSQEI
jgi:hypothetical protein